MKCMTCGAELEKGRYPPIILCADCVVKTMYPDGKRVRKPRK